MGRRFLRRAKKEAYKSSVREIRAICLTQAFPLQTNRFRGPNKKRKTWDKMAEMIKDLMGKSADKDEDKDKEEKDEKEDKDKKDKGEKKKKDKKDKKEGDDED